MVKKNKGLSVGNLIQVYKLRQGVSKQNYKWQLFMFSDTKYDNELKKYVNLGYYTIFIKNPIEDLREKDVIRIDKILAISSNSSTYNGRVYKQTVVTIEARKFEKKQQDVDNLDTSVEQVDDPTSFDVGMDNLPF